MDSSWWRFAKRNLETPARKEALDWKDPAAVTSLNEMYQRAETFALETANWYTRKKGWPSRVSRMSRGVAIVLLIAGMLSPLVSSMMGTTMTNQVAQLGYIALALAGSALLIDRFGSFSTAWMRYITTNLRIQRLLRTFQIDWQVGKAQLDLETDPDARKAKIFAMLAKLREFTDAVSQAVEDETAAWVAEFRDTLAELQRTIREKQEQAAPRSGSVRVTVTNYDKAGVPVQLFVDGYAVAQMSEATRLVTPVAPGSHVVMARAFVKNDLIEKSATVEVPSGGEVSATITLPMPTVGQQESDGTHPSPADDKIIVKEPEKQT